MKIVVVSGSHRAPSMTRAVSDYLARRLEQGLDCEATVVDLGAAPLPLWDAEATAGSVAWHEHFAPVLARLQACDALVLVTPEWGGMATPALKNLLLLAPPEAVGHKPALLAAVSAGIGGAYPIAELRMTAAKNNRICLLPEHLIVRGVHRLVDDGAFDMARDPELARRADYCLELLYAYGRALAEVRASGVIDGEAFPFGM